MEIDCNRLCQQLQDMSSYTQHTRPKLYLHMWTHIGSTTATDSVNSCKICQVKPNTSGRNSIHMLCHARSGLPTHRTFSCISLTFAFNRHWSTKDVPEGCISSGESSLHPYKTVKYRTWEGVLIPKCNGRPPDRNSFRTYSEKFQRSFRAAGSTSGQLNRPHTPRKIRPSYLMLQLKRAYGARKFHMHTFLNPYH